MTAHSNLWFEQVPQPSKLLVGLPREADVVIIGGGLAGLTTLHTLLQETKLNVILLEEGQLGFHASGREIGNFNLFHFQMMHNLDQKSTHDHIDLINHNNTALVKFIEQNKLACDFNKIGGIYLSANSVETDLINNAYGILNKDYKRTIFSKLLSNSEIFDLLNSNVFNVGLFIPGEFNLHPYKLIYNIANICDPKHDRIFTDAAIDGITQTAAAINIHVKSRGVISTKYVVYAGGSYCNKLIPGINKQLNFYKYHVIATNPISGSFLSHFPSICMNLNGIKIRKYEDRLLVQGMPSLVNEKYYDGDINPRSCELLKKALKTMWPVLGAVGISHAWSYVTCSAKDTKALVGEIPNRPKEFMNIGHNINSVIIASNIIKDLITDHKISLNEFDPGRKV